MGLRLIAKGFLSYGMVRVRGKMLVLVFLAAPAWAEPVTVLALGDSLIQGYGLAPAQGFVPQMQAWLDARGADAELVNGGVSGDTTAGGAARVEWSLTPEIDAMIVTLGGNDMLRGLDPAQARANLAAILEAAQARGLPVLLTGMPAPGNFGPDYQAAFDAVYPELARDHGTLYAENFFAGLGEGDPAVLQRFFQPDAIHPNAEGVARIVEGLGPKVLALIARAK